MENFSYHVPFYVVTGGVSTSGHSSELPNAQVGLFDRSTFSIATSSGNGTEFFFAQGSLGGKDWYGFSVSESHKSPFFFGKDVTNMYLSLPKTIQNEEWVIGFNGSPSSKSLSFETGKPIRVKFYFHGAPTYRFWSGPKEFVVSYTPPVDCSQPCDGNDCPDPIVDCLTHTQALINEINNHVELQKFGVQAKLVNDPFTAVTPNMEKFKLEVCDNGDSIAVNAVKAQYPNKTITRIAREGSISTYEFCQAEALATPADFAQSGSVLLAVCETCPAGSTLTVGTDAYYVERVVTPSTDLSTSGARQTYADAIGTAYEASLVATIPTTDVNTTTEVFTETGHKFVTGQKVTYSNGGGTSATGLTSGTDYYVIKVSANTFKVATTYANALAGTAINITGTGNNAQTFTPVITASFIGLTEGVATVRLNIEVGSVLTALLSDKITLTYSSPSTCVFAAPTAIAWAASGVGISSSRTLRINGINRPDCDTDGNRLEDLTAILSGVEGINIGSLTLIAGVGCADDYTVTQNSVDCLPEDCLTNNVTFTYTDLPAFENKSWEVVPVVPTENEDRKCGIRVTAGYIDPKFGNCSFVPTDYYENEPLKMEVSLLQEDGSNCDYASLPSVHQSRVGRMSRQSGEYIVREVIMKTVAYQRHMQQFSLDARDREAFDRNLLDMVDRNAFYKLYYVSFKASYGASFRKNEQEKFTAVFAFKENDPAALTFENNVLSVLTAKSGVKMHIAD